MWHNRRLRQLAGFVLLAALIGGLAYGQMSFREACGGGTEQQVMEAALRNPALALQQSSLLLALPFRMRVLERTAMVAPDETMAIAAGLAKPSLELRGILASGSPQMRVLADLAGDATHEMPARRRVAPLAAEIARGAVTWDAAWKLAAGGQRYFSELARLREAASTGGSADEAAGLDRALEAESVTLCRAAQESSGRTLTRDLAGFRATDIYLTLAFGGADCGEVFPEAFDRFLVPKLGRNSLTPFLERSNNWMLREFTAAVLDAGRFEKLLIAAGADALSKLASGITEVSDATEIAEIAGASDDAELRKLLAQRVTEELERAHGARERRGEILYGLLAARLSLPGADAGYTSLLRSSAALDTAVLFDSGNRCVERYFFWDDDDGVQSFANFLKAYEHDAAWNIEDRGGFVRLTGRGAGGRVVEIFANVPIDIRLPANRGRDGEALRRQALIAAELQRRGLSPTLLVHRGHSFHVEKTLAFVTPAARLVVLGSCRGVPEIHRVIEASHRAQVIATRGIGAMEVNDAILKGLNTQLLSANGQIRWADFWRQQQSTAGKSALFQNYVRPDRDEASAFLRAYYQALDLDK
jgi:hypothetical protein